MMDNKFYLYGSVIERTVDLNNLIYSLPYVKELSDLHNLFIPENYKNGSVKLVIKDKNKLSLEVILLSVMDNIKSETIYQRKKDKDKEYKFTISFYTNYSLNLTLSLINNKFNFAPLRRLFYEFFKNNSQKINKGYYYNNHAFFIRKNKINLGYGYEFNYLEKKKKFKVNYKYKFFYEINNYDAIDLISPLIKRDLNNIIYVDNFEDITKIVREKLYNYHEYNIIEHLRKIKKLELIDFII